MWCLQANPSELDQAGDLASLLSVNESSVLNTLLQRYRAQLPHTCSGPDLIALKSQRTTVPSSGKVRWDHSWGQGQAEVSPPGHWRGIQFQHSGKVSALLSGKH